MKKVAFNVFKIRLQFFVKKILIRPVFISFLVFIFSSIIVIGFTRFKYGYDEDFLKSVFIEAHGMLFDILIIGVVIFSLHKLIEKKHEIKRYQEEIDDFRNWDSDEAKFRIVGNIKRLNRMFVTRINLNNCILHNAQLEDAALREANLESVILDEASLKGVDFSWANLRHAEFNKANLLGADFKYSNLYRAFFREADLTYAEFDRANMQGAQLQSAIIEYEQLSKAKTLYEAGLDSNIREEIEKKYPHLLKKPKEAE